jgi:Tfp pilus tip-associated adhesin PilY1
MTARLRLLTTLVLVLISALPAGADDKDFLRPVGDKVPPNLLIVFGNSQTTTQAISFLDPNVFGTFNGDGDSPVSKLGAAKKVVRQFIADHHTDYNIGMTGFSRPPNMGSTSIFRKHWIYEAIDTDFPFDSFRDVAGTLHRWGPLGEGPCTSKTVPACTDHSPAITLASNATIVGPFFAFKGNSPAFIYLNGNASGATQRIRYDMTAGEYGDAFTDGTLATLAIGGTHSVEVTKQYQTKELGNWVDKPTPDGPAGNSGKAVVRYRPPATFPQNLFYTNTADPASPHLGKAVGFLNEPTSDFDMNANCSGWEFQVNSGQVPLIKIPRDYFWGAACNPPQDSLPCAKRLLRAQGYIETYNQSSGAFATDDPDNPGYFGSGSKYADGCDPNLLGAVQNGLDSVERTVLLTARNGSQAPIKNILDNILAYFTETRHDGFLNGARTDDPNAACRNSAVIFIYDTFNGCQNDTCNFLKNSSLNALKLAGVPVYVIGFGAQANSGLCAASPLTDACPLVCIPQHSGALKLDKTPGYFPVTSEVELMDALLNIASLVNESQKGFVASTVSVAQASGEQVTFLATFNATGNRSIWNGRVNAYKLDPSGNLQMGVRTIRDVNDPLFNVKVPAPSNADTSLMWNAGENLADTPGTGATTPSAVLAPGAPRSTSNYTDNSTDVDSIIDTSFYPGRKIVFSLPQTVPDLTDPSATLPIPAANAVPENRFDMVYDTSATWWPTLKALLSPQTTPPFVLNPAIDDVDAGNSLRFIWGDRDPIILAAQPGALAATLYSGLKLGDIFHASPVLVGPPNDFAYFTSNLNNYQAFRETYRRRRRVLIFGANDGLLHALDAGAWNRTPALCSGFESDGTTPKSCFDLGTGAELFAYAPRSIMAIFKPLKDAIGPQTRQVQWTVDGPPSAADVFIDAEHSGTPAPAKRAWHTILVGGMREGSPFEGTASVAPADTLGSYYALDITQPDALTADASGNPTTILPATFNAPLCLNANGDASCGKDAADATVRAGQPARAWPTVLWEIVDTGDLDIGSGSPGDGFRDMGESWAKPSVGRVKVCTADCGTQTAVLEDRYVAIFGGGFDRERLNRRGNWLYMVDVETGHVLYRANSSCGINSGSGCSPTYFSSIASEPSSLDGNGDGYIDIIYVGDLKGRMWRIDLTDLRLLSSPPTGRFENKIDVVAGSGRPFLFFETPQPVSPLTHPFYPVYYRPVVISLGFNIGGKPAVGVSFGTGDRDDITSSIEPLALTFNQRYYYVVDRNNSTTLTEADLLNITSPTAASVTTAPVNGWFLQLPLGERLNADALAAGGVIFFPTFNPLAALSGTNPCPGNSPNCGLAQGTARLYRVFYSTGNPYLGNDRGQTQTLGGFLSEPVYFQSQDQQGNIIFTTENTVGKENAPGAKKTAIKSWKERSRRP